MVRHLQYVRPKASFTSMLTSCLADSDIVYVDLPMQPTMILGSVTAALELLDKRSQNYSDRARFVVVEE